MGVQQELFETKNRPEGKGFRVVEEVDGSISTYSGDTVLVGPNISPLTTSVTPDGKGLSAVSGSTVLVGIQPRDSELDSMVLWGDSLEMNSNSPFSPTSVSYDNSTGVMTCTLNSHGIYPGQLLFLAVKKQPAWAKWSLSATRIDANNFSLQLSPGLGTTPIPTDVRVAYQTLLSSEGMYAWLKVRKPRLVRNCGVTDELASNILARAPQVAAVASGIVDIRMGTNDLLQATPTDYSTVFATLRSAVEFALGLGRKVIVHTIPPLGSPTAAQSQWNDRYRKLVLTIPSLYYGVQVCDDFAVMVDPASALGAAKSGFLLADGIHFSPRGAKACAPLFQACIDRLTQTVSTLPVSRMQAYDATNNPNGFDAITNGLLATATGGSVSAPVTGTAASGVSCTATGMGGAVTASVVAAAVGNAQRLVGSPAAAGDLMAVSFSPLVSRVVPGELRRFQCHVKTSGVPAAGVLKNITAFLLFVTPDGTFQRTHALYSYNATTAAQFAQEDVDMDLETELMPIPAGVTAVTARVMIEFLGAGSAVTFDVSQPALVLPD